MLDRLGPQPLAVAVGDEYLVGVLGPVHPGTYRFVHQTSIARSTRLIADRELPLRVLIDGPSTGLRPVAAGGSPTPGRSRSHAGLCRGKRRGLSPGGGRLRNPITRSGHDGKVDQ